MLRSKTTIPSPADGLQTFSAQKIESKLVKYIYWQIKLTIKLKGTLGHKFGKSCYDSKKHFSCPPSHLQHSPGLDNVTCNQNFSFSCSTDIYISGGPWIFMMLLYDDVYCQSNCLSVPGCQVLRGVIHNNNRAKPGSGHWAGDLKEPVRDLGKFPTHHRSPSQPIQVAPISIPDLWPDYTPADGLQAVLCWYSREEVAFPVMHNGCHALLEVTNIYRVIVSPATKTFANIFH